MDLIKKASDHMILLEQRVQQLEKQLKEKDEIIRRLSQELPGTSLKLERLGISSTERIQGGETAPIPSEWTAPVVRDTFIKYFTQRAGHTFWASSPCVPVNDPTLLFANSGMNQFKSIFLGQVDPTDPKSKLKRACNTQKCIRAGGKHNDLDDVGKDVYHHTFFEMLGNWSFGDYFKNEAIDWAYDLLVNVFGLDPNRLYTSYFGGDVEKGIPMDEEARNLWLKYFPTERVLPFGKKENWWSAGEFGPCGPCSEIHYDRIGNRNAAHLVNRDDPDVVEIWNLVFMQFNRREDGELERLPASHVDTGMGFERLVSCLQDKRSNYDTDVFAPILAAIHKACQGNTREYQGKLGKDDEADGGIDKAYRVVADHIRTLSFAITDGCVPSSDGRGYVLRRILRRAVRFAHDVLKMPRGGFSSLVPVVVSHMGAAFPELKGKQTFVQEVIEDEEQEFFRTLKKGREYFTKVTAELESKNQKVIPGDKAFYLYATMGFPVDLTQIMAEEKGFTVDVEGFKSEMENAREESRRHNKFKAGGGAVRKLEAKETDFLEKKGIAPTIEDSRYEWYKNIDATITAIFDPKADSFLDSITGTEDAAAVSASGEGASQSSLIGVILDRSNFYFESGGQQWDIGMLADVTAVQNSEDITSVPPVFSVENCQSSKGFIVHSGRVPNGVTLKVGDKVTCVVDYERRKRLASNHTCTHLLNLGLRMAVGTDIDQKGSLVAEDKFRFDFNSNGLDDGTLGKIESIVREQIAKAYPVNSKVVPLGDARRISSLRAVFGETYPDPVRLVVVGASIDDVMTDPANDKWNNYSIELCGGTHLRNTADARDFALLEEASIAKGIRRIVAVTGDAAVLAEARAEELASKISDASLENDLAKLDELYRELKADFEKGGISAARKGMIGEELNKLNKRLTLAKKGAKDAQAAIVNAEIDALLASGVNTPVLVYPFKANGNVIAKAVDDLQKKLPNTSVCAFMIDSEKNKLAIVIQTTAEHEAKGLSSKKWFEAISSKTGAKGGGPQGKVVGACETSLLSTCIEIANEFAKNVSL